METVIIGVGVVAYILFTIYMANLEYRRGDNQGLVRTLLFITPSLLGLLGLSVVFYALSITQMSNLSESELQEQFNISEVPNFPPALIAISLLICGIATVFTFNIIKSSQFRQSVQHFIEIRGGGKFNATSIVHTTAIVFVIFFLTINTIIYFVNGATINTEQIQISDVVLEGVVRIVVAFLGIGYAIRRTMPQSLERLGLRIPTTDDFRSAFIAVVGMFAILILFGIITELLFPENQLEQQTRDATEMAERFSESIPLILLISLTAALSEEILIRGALQPIFGLIPTSIFFALLHTQVLLTPAVIVIFIVGLALGILRQRYSTSSAIIAHFTYNFIILLFAQMGV